MPVIRLPELYPKQRDAFFHDRRIGLVEGSTKSGKSVAALCWLLARAWAHGGPGFNFLWCSPVYPQAVVMYRRLRRWLANADRSRTIWTPKDADLVIELESGSRIAFKGSDNHDAIYGDDYAGAVVDEASRCSEAAWFAVRSTVTATGGPIRAVGNVTTRQTWHWKLCRMAEAGDADMRYTRLMWTDAVRAGVLSMNEIRQASRTLPRHVFQALYEARAADDSGSPFGAAAIDRATMETLGDGPPVAYGVDLARSRDWTVVIGLNAQGHVCVFQRWQDDWRATIARVAGIVRDVPALVDSTGVGAPVVEELRQSCPNVEPFVFSSRSKQELMEALALMIQRGDLCFPEGVIPTELHRFTYTVTARGVRYEAPAGEHDDAVDALALAAELWGRERRIGAPVLDAGGFDDEDDELGWERLY